MLFVCHRKIFYKHCFSFSWELKLPQEKLKTMVMQNCGVINKEHYGMLWYFLEWSIAVVFYRVVFFLLLLYFLVVVQLMSLVPIQQTAFRIDYR